MDFDTFYSNINKNIDSFGFFGNFASNKRRELSKNVLEVVDFISKSELTDDQISSLCQLRLKMMNKLNGGVISNLFNKTFSKTKIDVKKLWNQEKKANKLRKAGIHPRHFMTILGDSEKAKKLDNLFFEEHIFERMQYFGHAATFNDKGEMTFRVSQDYFLKELISKKPTKINWKKLHGDWVKKGAFLEVKGEFKEGCYRTVAVDSLTIKQFKELLIENGTLNEKVRVIYPPKHLTVDELIDQNFIDEDGDIIRDDIKYTADGFRKVPSDWNNIPPFMHTSQPPKNFNLEILVHTKGLTPVISKDGDFGHASIKLSTPNGEVYSFGFYPSGCIDVLQGGVPLEKGDLLYVDPAIFYPSQAFMQQKLSYTLSDEKSFHQLMRWIAGMKGQDDNEGCNLFYHFTHHNCTHFAQDVRDFVLQHGGKADYWEEHKVSDWTKLGFRIKYKIFQVFVDFILRTPLGKLVNWDKGIEEHAGIKNFNIRHLNPKELVLPVQLLFEHLALQTKAIP